MAFAVISCPLSVNRRLLTVYPLFFPLFFFFSNFSFSQSLSEKFPVIPLPNSVKEAPGLFKLDSSLRIEYSNEFLKDEGEYLADEIEKITGIKAVVHPATATPAGAISLTYSNYAFKDSNSYELNTEDRGVFIKGGTYETVFYGIQTLLQLIKKGKTSWFVHGCKIKDYPKYSWRGMHLDVCRHFFTKEEVKKYLDHLARYKFNVFHWHLTDDQGWRIEIKKYPLLTQVGAHRKETIVGKLSDTAKYDGKEYGGFYTQEDIKEIVAYAAKLYITVVPEIEMPGHALAALASYPQFSCFGGKIEVGTRWGVYDEVFCPKEETFTFLQDVLTEIMQLFPGKYIHIGGDECVKTQWQKCPGCQKKIKELGLKDENGLQSYFIARIEKFLNLNGRQIIGWDEILDGGLAPNATVMSWRGTKGGIAAAQESHYVIMSPGKPCYFDHYQSKDKSKEPLAIGGYNPLDAVYLFDPTPKELNLEQSKFILGGQGNVWTEYITSFKQVEYMSLPRMCALSEALWTSKESKVYLQFTVRLKIHSKTLDKLGVNYAKHFKSVK
jgi:hexosaminidase